MESLTGIKYPKGDLEAYQDWIKNFDLLAEKKK